MLPEKKFIRDGRAPIPIRVATSNVMAANKAKNTKPEIRLREALWSKGIKGYRLHWKQVPGRPDIAFPSKKVAIFVNGCFWHRCPHCQLTMPKSNTFFWSEKFEKNIERDARKIVLLTGHGWRILVIWECQIKTNLNSEIHKITELIK